MNSSASSHGLKYRLQDIFRIERPGEHDRFEKSAKKLKDPSRLLPWHVGCALGPHGSGPKEVDPTRGYPRVGSDFKAFYGPNPRVPGGFLGAYRFMGI